MKLLYTRAALAEIEKRGWIPRYIRYIRYMRPHAGGLCSGCSGCSGGARSKNNKQHLRRIAGERRICGTVLQCVDRPRLGRAISCFWIDGAGFLNRKSTARMVGTGTTSPSDGRPQNDRKSQQSVRGASRPKIIVVPTIASAKVFQGGPASGIQLLNQRFVCLIISKFALIHIIDHFC